MNNDNKKFLMYLGIIFIAVLLTYKLPYDSYSISQYIIRPIGFGNSIIYLSGIVPFVLLAIGIRGLIKLNRFTDKSKLLIVIIIMIVIFPLMRFSLDIAKSSYFWVTDNELKSLNLVDANILITDTVDSEVTLKVTLELIDYGRSEKNFNVRTYLPESMIGFFNKEYLEFKDLYSTFGNRDKIVIQKNIPVQFKRGYTIEDLGDSKWYLEDFEFELYNEEDHIKLINRGY